MVHHPDVPEPAEQVRRPGGPPIVLGVTAEGATGSDIAVVLRDALGLNIRIIAGYPDSNGLFLAVDRKELDGTLFSLFLSCLTTVFIFGTLAISQHAALRAMGSTTGLGILISFALAPITLLLLPPGERVP